MAAISRACVALLLLSVNLQPCFGQNLYAAVAGTVRSRNQALPGVKVLLVPDNSSRVLATSTTGRDGRFAFGGLPCGEAYALSFSRDAWKTETLAHLRLHCGGTVAVNVSLHPDIDGRSRAAPEVVDQLPEWGEQFTGLQVEKLPNTRNLWSLLETQEPSTVTSRIDVAGLETGEPALFGALGASWTENQYSLNGLNLTDPYQPGFLLADPNLDDLAEFNVVAGAKSAGREASGTDIVLATAEPGGNLHGAARVFYSSRALQSDNFNARLERFHFPGSERMNHLADGSLQLGGMLPSRLASLPFFASFSTQQVSKDLGGFPSPIAAKIYRGLGDVTAFSHGTQKLDFFLAAQHVFNSRQGAALGVAPSATTRGNRNFQQLQARWSKVSGGATVFSARAGMINAVLSSAIQNGTSDISVLDLPELALSGAAPLSRSGVRTRYQVGGSAQTIRAGAAGTHSLSAGAGWDRSDISNRWYALENMQAVTVGGIGSEVVRWNTPAQARQHIQNIGEFVQDSWRPSRWITLTAGLRVDTSTGSAAGAASDINWTTPQPRFGLVLPLRPRGLMLEASWARYGHVLQGHYLDFGNPAALGGKVFRWQDKNGDGEVQPQEIGTLVRVFGGPYSALAHGITRPFTDEFSFGAEQELGAGFSASVRFFRRDDHRLLALNNAGVPFSDYTPVAYLDPGNDGIFGTPDDQLLTLYNRLPSALGKDRLVLGNYGFHASYKGMEAQLIKRLFHSWAFAASFTASRTLASTSPGNSVFQDDTGFIGALGADPNTLLFAQGRTHFDRAFTGKVSGYYSAPLGFHLGAVAAYYDGLPFGRLLFINGFNQGPFFVRATPVGHPGGFQTELNATLDARVARDFPLRQGRLSAYFDVFNVLNANSNTLESALSGPQFLTRVPLTVESPRTARLGIEWSF